MKIPKHAKKVFTGKIFDVYQWPQKMFDDSVETFERLRRPSSLSTIAVVGNKILVNYEQQPGSKREYTLPAGRQNMNESPLKGAKRELLEETGFGSKNWELYKKYNSITKLDWTCYYYIARDCKLLQKPKLDPGERIDVEKVSFDEFIDVILSDNFWGIDFALDIAKMKLNGKLKDFKKLLFK